MGWAMSAPATATLDTGTSYLYMPKSVFPQVMQALLRGKESVRAMVDKQSYYFSSCDTATYNSIYLLIESTWFEIPPTAFVTATTGYTLCQLQLGAADDETWILGGTFLRNYYSVWDNDNKQVGLAPHTTSVAKTVALADLALPTKVFTPSTIWDLVVTIAGYAAIAGIAGIVVVGALFIA